MKHVLASIKIFFSRRLKRLPNATVKAAKSFVSDWINGGYEDDFLVLNSRMLNLERHKVNEDWVVVVYEHISVMVEGLKAHKFDDYLYGSGSITFDENELVAANGVYISNDRECLLGAIEEVIEWDPHDQSAFRRYLNDLAPGQLEQELFEQLIDSEFFLDNPFDISGCWEEYSDIRIFYEDAFETLKLLETREIDLKQENRWWSHLSEVLSNDATYSMFERVLRFRLKKLQELINKVPSQKSQDGVFDLQGSGLAITLNSTEKTVSNNVKGPFLIAHLRSRGGNPMRSGSFGRLMKEAKDNGSEIRSLTGIFAGTKTEDVSMVSNVNLEFVNRLLEATYDDIALWVSEDGSPHIIKMKDYFDPHNFIDL